MNLTKMLVDYFIECDIDEVEMDDIHNAVDGFDDATINEFLRYDKQDRIVLLNKVNKQLTEHFYPVKCSNCGKAIVDVDVISGMKKVYVQNKGVFEYQQDFEVDTVCLCVGCGHIVTDQIKFKEEN